MLIEIPPKDSVSRFMGILKRKEPPDAYEEVSELNTNTEIGILVLRYHVDTAGKNAKKIQEYI